MLGKEHLLLVQKGILGSSTQGPYLRVERQEGGPAEFGSVGGSPEAFEALDAGHLAEGSAPLDRATCVWGPAGPRGGAPGFPPLQSPP